MLKYLIAGPNSMLGTVHISTRHAVSVFGGSGEIAADKEPHREMNLRHGKKTIRGSWRLGLLGRESESFDTDAMPGHGEQVFDSRGHRGLK